MVMDGVSTSYISSTITTIDIGSREFVFISCDFNRPFLLPPEKVLALGMGREEEDEDDEGISLEPLVAR